MIDEVSNKSQTTSSYSHKYKIKIATLSNKNENFIPIGTTIKATVINNDNSSTKIVINNKIYNLQLPFSVKNGTSLTLQAVGDGEFLIKKVSDSNFQDDLFSKKNIPYFFQVLGISPSKTNKLFEILTKKYDTPYFEIFKSDVFSDKVTEKIFQILSKAINFSDKENNPKTLYQENALASFQDFKTKALDNLVPNILKKFISLKSTNNLQFSFLQRLDLILQNISSNKNSTNINLEKSLLQIIKQQSDTLADLCTRLPILVGNGASINPLQSLNDLLKIKLNHNEKFLEPLFKEITNQIFNSTNNQNSLEEALLKSYQRALITVEDTPVEKRPLLRMLEARLQLAFYDLEFYKFSNNVNLASSSINKLNTLQNAYLSFQQSILHDFLEQLRVSISTYYQDTEDLLKIKKLEILLSKGIAELTKPLEDFFKEFKKTDQFNQHSSKNNPPDPKLERYNKLKENIAMSSEMITSSSLESYSDHHLLNNLSTVMNIIGEPSFFVLPFLLAGQNCFLELSHNSRNADEKEMESDHNKKKQFQKFSFQIELPKLGKIVSDVCYLEDEVLLQLQLENKKSIDLIDSIKEMLVQRLKKKGYEKINITIEKIENKKETIRPPWVAEIISKNNKIIV